MFERFPEQSVRTLFIARSLAVLAGSPEILPEHLVGGALGALSDATALPPPSPEEIPFSAAVQRLLNDAMAEADRLGQHLIRPQHLLLAVLRSHSHAAALVRQYGLDYQQLESDATVAAEIDDRPIAGTGRLEVGQRRDSFRNE
jgi:hypothetical protein